MHKGVGLIISNKSKTLFFVQQKDENYPVKKWAGCYSFWGGKVEESDDSLLEALKRELFEEIKANIDFDVSKINPIGEFIIDCDEKFLFNLFELVLPEDQLHKLQSAEIYEGYGTLISLNELKRGKWIWCLEQVVAEYICL